MVQFENSFYFWLASSFSVFFLFLSFFTIRRVHYFKKRDIARSIFWSGIIIFLGAAISGAKANWEISLPVKEKIEIIFSLDCSLSSLARDIVIAEKEETRTISRLDMGKMQIENVIELLGGDAVGIIAFADYAIPLQKVLSKEDYKNSLLRNLQYIDEDFIRHGIKQGTDYGALIIASLEQFGKKDDGRKIHFILTDGEPQGDETKLKENLKKSLGLSAERNDIIIYLICIGNSRELSKIPKIEDSRGNIEEYYADENGEPVFTRPNPEFLINLANSTGGKFIQAESSQNLKDIMMNSIEKERRIVGFEKHSKSIDLAPYLLICSLVFLFVIPILKSV